MISVFLQEKESAKIKQKFHVFKKLLSYKSMITV